MIGKLRRGLLNHVTDENLIHFLQGDTASSEDITFATHHPFGDTLGRESQANAIGANNLHARRLRLAGCFGRFLGRIGLLGMEPDDLGNPVARHFLGFKTSFDLKRLVVELDHSATEVVAVHRSDELERRRILLHPREREQPVALGLADPRRHWRFRAQFHRLDLGVADKCAIRKRSLKGEPFFINFGDLRRDHVAGSKIQVPRAQAESRSGLGAERPAETSKVGEPSRLGDLWLIRRRRGGLVEQRVTVVDRTGNAQLQRARRRTEDRLPSKAA